ncbi:uncharacterized protein LOC122065291 [Macadamia integrifolia]|uniref:uncharacterized protein LOC122065291 n=1 Tax=Macadamia integrifolia TaxID=60698 RepID=UPI001C4F52A8|nr:uncharacterized protein LOC122065291 [Macadamia integrifolia]
MRVLFWNIRGVRKEAGRRALKFLLRESSPEILCVAEPMVEVSSFPSLFFDKLGYAAEVIPNNRQDRVPNIWVIWKRGMARPSLVSMSDQQLIVEIDWMGKRVLMSFIHASCFKIERRSLWSDLASISTISSPWVVIGDFNATLMSHEKRGPGNFNLGSAVEFQAMADSCMLFPYPSQGKKYTWSNNRKRGNVLAVLDRSFYNEQWIDEFKNVFQGVLTCSASDHSPLLIQSFAVPKPPNIPFRFHSFWMENNGFLPLVENVWSQSVSGNPISRLAQRLKNVKLAVKAWAKGAFPNLNEEVDKATSNLKRVQDSIAESGMTDLLFNEEADARTGLLNASKLHEKMWSEKAKIKWLKNGDRNSKFFHLSGAFQKGKIISSNIGLASELANLMQSAVRGGGMGIKLDVQKAYDSLSWDFLLATLEKFGFSPKWINRVHQLLISTRISILLNGGPVGFFGVGRGLRQGDPISPILFILAEEVLCRGLKNMVVEGKMKSLSGPRGAITPSHLLFVDDIFIFMNGSATYVKQLHAFLSKYQEFSGQMINLEKSKIFFGKIAPHRRQFITEYLGVAAATFPTKYLGVEIFKGRVKNNHLLPLLDNIKSRLAGWKGKLLSIAGRVELVKSVISGIPIHNFSIYWWPEGSMKLVERWI